MNRPNVSLICFFLGIILLVFLVYPKYQELMAVTAQIKLKDIELQSKEKYLSNLIELSEEFKKYEEQLAFVDSVLPQEPSLPPLFHFLQKTATQSGLILKGTSSTYLPSLEDLKETTITLEMTGYYSSLKEFLSTIEKSARMIETESISFSTPEKEETFSFDLTIKVYSY